MTICLAPNTLEPGDSLPRAQAQSSLSGTGSGMLSRKAASRILMFFNGCIDFATFEEYNAEE
jgi:hypothetical protein